MFTFFLLRLLLCRVHAQVHGIQQQEVDGRNDFGRGLIGRLILNEVGRFFVERYARDAPVLVLQLLQNQVGGIGIGRSIRRIASDLRDQVGIGIDRCLPVGQGVIGNRGEIGQIPVATGGTVGTG